MAISKHLFTYVRYKNYVNRYNTIQAVRQFIHVQVECGYDGERIQLFTAIL